MVEFTSKKTAHTDLMDNIETLLQEKGQAKRSTIAQEVETPKKWSDDYLRKLLIPEALKKMKEDNRIKIAERRKEGGNPTIYWTVKQ